VSSATDICKRNELWALIKKVSNYYEGDNSEWLKEYGREMLKSYSLDDALTAFRDIGSRCIEKLKPIGIKTNLVTKDISSWQLQPPFKGAMP